MPDDPNKRGPQDRGRTSKQEHEQRYQNEKKKRETPSSEPRKKGAGRNPGENEA